MRTSLWRVLDRARALHLASIGAPPAQPCVGGISRRRVLAALAAGAGLAGAPLWGQPVARRKVIVVGGGLAGLTALHRLKKLGADARLYEARSSVGGRIRSRRGVFAPDFAFDEGGQLINSDHSDMHKLVRTLGLRLVERGKDGRELQIGRRGNLIAEAVLAEALHEIAGTISADSDRLDGDYENVAREIDALSVASYLDRHGLGAGDARDVIEAGIRTEYGLEPSEASALQLLFNLPTVDGHRLTRLSLSDELYCVDGGAGLVTQALASRMAGAIRLGKRLSILEIDDKRVRLAFADGEEVAAERVILALPAPLLREIRIEGAVPSLSRELIGEVRLGTNEKLIVGYDRQPWRAALRGSGAVWAADGFSEAWDAASAAPTGSREPGALTYLLGGAQVGAAKGADMRGLQEHFTATAKLAFPRLPDSNGRVRRTHWCDDPLTRGTYIGFRPGQLTRFGGLLTLEEEGEVRPSGTGPLLFAGEWLSDAWPGYMNGAAQTGRIAADAAMAGEGIVAAPVGAAGAGPKLASLGRK